MKKRITAALCVCIMILSLGSTAFAAGGISIDVSITDASDVLTHLSGNNLKFEIINFPGAQAVNFMVDEAALSVIYNNPEIRYYTFTFNSLTVRADKNNFYDFDLEFIKFTVTDSSFDVTLFYKDGTDKKLTETAIDMRYTVTAHPELSKASVAVMNGQTVFCTESSEQKLVFNTKNTGSFKIEKFTFSDVAKGQWYYDYVNTAGAYGIVSGVGAGVFDPSRSIKRCELATMIVKATSHIINYRVNENLSFTDVPEGQWYYEFVNKCAGMGLMSGVGNGKFDPMATATRQEVAVVAANFVKLIGSYNGGPLPEGDKTTDELYLDSNKIASWAKSSAVLCADLEIMVGSDGRFYPTRAINRAEAAKIFHDIFFKAVKE